MNQISGVEAVRVSRLPLLGTDVGARYRDDLSLSVAYLSASLEAIEVSDPLRGVLRQILWLIEHSSSKDIHGGVDKDSAGWIDMLPAKETQSELQYRRVLVRKPQRIDTEWQDFLKRPLPTLNDIEVKILQGVGQGLKNDQIGELLGLKTTSIATRLNRVYAKLGAKRRYQAYRIARELGLLNVE